MSEAIKTHQMELKEHGLHGLALQMQDRMANQAIRKLTATYLTLSLVDLAKEAGLEGPDAAQTLLAKCVIDWARACVAVLHGFPPRLQ
jgi:hypothetical protein